MTSTKMPTSGPPSSIPAETQGRINSSGPPQGESGDHDLDVSHHEVDLHRNRTTSPVVVLEDDTTQKSLSFWSRVCCCVSPCFGFLPCLFVPCMYKLSTATPQTANYSLSQERDELLRQQAQQQPNGGARDDETQRTARILQINNAMQRRTLTRKRGATLTFLLSLSVVAVSAVLAARLLSTVVFKTPDTCRYSERSKCSQCVQFVAPTVTMHCSDIPNGGEHHLVQIAGGAEGKNSTTTLKIFCDEEVEGGGGGDSSDGRLAIRRGGTGSSLLYWPRGSAQSCVYGEGPTWSRSAASYPALHHLLDSFGSGTPTSGLDGPPSGGRREGGGSGPRGSGGTPSGLGPSGRLLGLGGARSGVESGDYRYRPVGSKMEASGRSTGSQLQQFFESNAPKFESGEKISNQMEELPSSKRRSNVADEVSRTKSRILSETESMYNLESAGPEQNARWTGIMESMYLELCHKALLAADVGLITDDFTCPFYDRRGENEILDAYRRRNGGDEDHKELTFECRHGEQLDKCDQICSCLGGELRDYRVPAAVIASLFCVLALATLLCVCPRLYKHWSDLAKQLSAEQELMKNDFNRAGTTTFQHNVPFLNRAATGSRGGSRRFVDAQEILEGDSRSDHTTLALQSGHQPEHFSTGEIPAHKMVYNPHNGQSTVQTSSQIVGIPQMISPREINDGGGQHQQARQSQNEIAMMRAQQGQLQIQDHTTGGNAMRVQLHDGVVVHDGAPMGGAAVAQSGPQVATTPLAL